MAGSSNEGRTLTPLDFECRYRKETDIYGSNVLEKNHAQLGHQHLG